MIRRILDWGGSLGLVALAAGVVLPFAWPGRAQYRGFLLIAGALLVLASLLARVENYRSLLGSRTTRYGLDEQDHDRGVQPVARRPAAEECAVVLDLGQ